MSEWLKWLLLGILSIVLGLFALNHAVITSLAVTTFVGALVLIAGIVQTIAGFGDEGIWNKFLSIGLGLLVALLGVSFLANPFAGTLSLGLVVTIFIGAAGLLRLIFAFQMRGTGFFWMMLLSGVLSLGLAGYIIANPALTIAILGILLGVELLFNGIGLVVAAFFLRSHKDEARA